MNFEKWHNLSAMEQVLWAQHTDPAIVRNFICILWCEVNDKNR